MAEPVRFQNIRPAGGCRYDVAALGEVMLRLDPRDVPVARMRAAVLTALVDNAVGANIRNQLREAGVGTSLILWWNTKSDGSHFSTDQKGSLHNGINFTCAGAGVLESSTLYYRAHTPATLLAPGDFDWDELFAAEGVRVFSTGGIFTLIGPRTAELALEVARKAAEHSSWPRTSTTAPRWSRTGKRPGPPTDGWLPGSVSWWATTPTWPMPWDTRPGSGRTPPSRSGWKPTGRPSAGWPPTTPT